MLKREQVVEGLRVKRFNALIDLEGPKEGVVTKVRPQSFDVTWDDATTSAGVSLTYNMLRHYQSGDPLDIMLDAVSPLD